MNLVWLNIRNEQHSSYWWFCYPGCQKQKRCLDFKTRRNPLLFTTSLLPAKQPPQDDLASQPQAKMCKVHCRSYECGHSFHEVEKCCPKFYEALNVARKNSDLKDYRCEHHGKKNSIDRCKGVKPVNGGLDEKLMIHINDIHGPWSVARRRIIGGHCATPHFLDHPRLKECGNCKSWFGFWK